MTREDIQHLVGMQLGLPTVNPDARFFEDLGAESMDVVSLAVAIEDRFDVFIPEEKLADLKTTNDLYTFVAGELSEQK